MKDNKRTGAWLSARGIFEESPDLQTKTFGRLLGPGPAAPTIDQNTFHSYFSPSTRQGFAQRYLRRLWVDEKRFVAKGEFYSVRFVELPISIIDELLILICVSFAFLLTII